MKVFKLLYVLFQINLLSPVNIFRLLLAFRHCGINLMALLDFANRVYPNRTALVDDKEIVTFQELYLQAIRLASAIKEETQLISGQKVGFLCKNHGTLVKAIFAVSRLGADVYLLNSEMSVHQFNELVERHDFQLVLYDEELVPIIEQSIHRKRKIMSYHDHLPAISNFLHSKAANKMPRASGSRLVLQTGGTTGKFKEAAHQPSLFHYLNPFITLVGRLKLTHYQTAYIATPIYHGYGIAILLLFIALGKKAVISKGFEAEKACRLISEHKVEVVTVVPLMLQKMLQHPEKLETLTCIASGGAKLPITLVEKTFASLGDVLYNLYGTSEAGLNMVATPDDLRYSAKTIGKKIIGTRLKVLDENKQEVQTRTVGQFCIKNEWSMRNRKEAWIETGDLGYVDERGYYFLAGRVDEMIVSGGENVYPIELEQILIQHPDIEDVAVIGINDEQFTQRLQAFIVVTNLMLSKEELFQWLRGRIARYQTPKEITFITKMPYTALGKLDKKKLKSGQY